VDGRRCSCCVGEFGRERSHGVSTARSALLRKAAARTKEALWDAIGPHLWSFGNVEAQYAT
jgi:hypothetical protein